MSIKKKEKLLLNLLEGEKKHKHRVAMVTEEGAFNQHEPNSNMARMFVIMLLIHVVVIGGIIVYDFMNGEQAPATQLSQDFNQQNKSGLPDSKVSGAPAKSMPLEEFSTYAWQSGDSLPLVAQKLGVSEEVLIKVNRVDQGRQINTNDVIHFPKLPVRDAVPISRAGVNGELAQPAVHDSAIAAAEVPISLAIPDEKKGINFISSNIMDELTPAPMVAPGQNVQDNPPPAVNTAASGNPVRVELPVTPKVQEAPPATVAVPTPAPVVAKKEQPVIKAIPVSPRAEPAKQQALPAPAPKPAAVKKVAETPPPARKEPAKPAAATGSSHVVQSGDTLYRIAAKHGVSVNALQAANKITNPQALKIGMKLTIPRK